MNTKGVLYIDKRGREVLYVPYTFVVINYIRRMPEVILDPKKLKCRQLNWKVGRTSMERIINYPEIDKVDIDSITGLCFKNKIAEAKSYCVDIFDWAANEAFKID